jgi:putative hydroxymethylpyrimidine transport system ATP-binding protein
LLDEPFGALDSLTRTDMQCWLDGVRGQFDWTVLMITHDIREAVYLADRVIVLAPRPAQVRRVVDIDLPRPREIGMIATEQFATLERDLLAALKDLGSF